PGSARLGLHDGEWDPGWWVLKGFQRAGLVWNLRLPEDLAHRPELHALNGNLNPGRGQRTLNNFPVLDPVIHASRISGPPKQMFAVTGSGTATSPYAPDGSNAVTPPFHNVATQMRPPASTARLSSH